MGGNDRDRLDQVASRSGDGDGVAAPVEGVAAAPGQVFTRSQLLDVLGPDYEGLERTIDSHIKNLRSKIESEPRHPAFILTVFGVGYKFSET